MVTVIITRDFVTPITAWTTQDLFPPETLFKYKNQAPKEPNGCKHQVDRHLLVDHYTSLPDSYS